MVGCLVFSKLEGFFRRISLTPSILALLVRSSDPGASRSAHPGVCEGVLSSDHRGNDEDTILER
jgi:hypothetical protein